MAQKTAFEAKGRQHIAVKEFNVYLTLIYIHTQRFIAIGKANGKSSTFTIKNNSGFTHRSCGRPVLNLEFVFSKSSNYMSP